MAFSTKIADVALSGTPLRHFKGKFVDLSVVSSYGKDKAVLDFVDVVIIKSILPYNLPVIRLENLGVSYTPDGRLRGNCTFGKLVTSTSVFGTTDFMDLKGHMLELQATERELTITDKETKEKQTNKFLEWVVVAIDGKGKPSDFKPVSILDTTPPKVIDINEHILKILDGKTVITFSQAVLADPDVAKAGNTVLSKLFDKSLVEEWLKEGRVKMDGDKFVVVKK